MDMETTEQALTAEDRAALAALGSPQDVVARLLAKLPARMPEVSLGEGSAVEQVHRSTVVELAADVNTQVTAQPRSPELTQQFDQLLGRLRDCESVEKMSWSCDYHKTKKIGQGGQGTVFLAECLNEHNLPKALKIFSPEPYGDGQAYNEDMRRMGDVVSLIYRIQVDNLVIVERFADHHGVYVMIMRWIDGYDLAKLLQPGLFARLRKLMDPALARI